MTERNFRSLLERQWDKGNFLCVGLDGDIEKIPESARKDGIAETLVGFHRTVIDATRDLVCAYKPNSAFYERYGAEGIRALEETIAYAHEVSPDVPIILDAKRADLENTNKGYVEGIFDHLKADAVTVHPYIGSEGLAPFLERKDKGIVVLCRTSNPGAGEFQDLLVDGTSTKLGTNEPLYMKVARNVGERWNTNGNCMIVVGATYPDELKQIRAVVPDLPILIPGIGAQGGDLEKSVRAGRDARGRGFILSTSRAVIYASGAADYQNAIRARAQEYDRAIRSALVG